MRKIELWRRCHAPVPLCALSFAAFSCVNSDYDIEKPIDMTVNLLKDVALPVGDVQKLYLKDILLGDDESLVGISADGDYHITFAQGNLDTEIMVPAFEYEGFTHNVSIKTWLTEGAGRISGNADFGTVHFKYDMESYSLPQEVTGLKRCDVSSSIQLSLRTVAGQGQMSLAAGAEIRFPDFLVISSNLPYGISRTGASLSAINAENQQIAKQTPNFTPKNVKLGVFVFFKIDSMGR